MLINKAIRIVIVLLVISLYQGRACAQQRAEFYQLGSPVLRKGIGFRAGTTYSSPTVTTWVDKQTNVTARLGGVRPRFGYYISGFTYKDIVPDQVVFRLDAMFQRRGVGADYNGRTTVKASYYYLGISPQLGIQLVKPLTVYVGAEANSLVSKINSWGKADPFEVSGLIRIAYQVGQFGLEGSYCKGFTKYDRLILSFPGIGTSTHDFYNQTIQLGLLYKLSPKYPPDEMACFFTGLRDYSIGYPSRNRSGE